MAPLVLIQCGSTTLPCCCAKQYENAVVCICLRCAPFTLEWKPTCTHQHLASVARGKRPQSAFICESTDPAGVHRYLWTPAAISCDGNMTLGGADWTRLLLLLYCDVGVLKSRTLALLFIVHRTFLHKLFLNIAPSVNHSKKKRNVTTIPLPASKSHAESATLHLEQLHPNIRICSIFLEGGMGF